MKPNKETIKWVTHSQGGAIFAQAVSYHNRTKGTPLDKHTVYFQATANNMLMTKRILKKAQVNLHKDGYNNSPIDGVPQWAGSNAITDVFVRPGLKSLARLALSPLALVPGLLPLAFTGPKLSTHTRPYQGLGNYGKQAASAVNDMLSSLIKRFV